jgi:predicted ArsR family transcriptional regulator
MGVEGGHGQDGTEDLLSRDAHVEGPRCGSEPVTDKEGVIRLRNCPFDALTDAHRPLVCGTNLAIAQGMTRGSGATSVRPVLDFRPALCCVVFVPDTNGPA